MAKKKESDDKDGFVEGDKHEAMDLGFALFNITNPVFERVKKGFLRRFGHKAWDESGIQKLWETGIMAILQDPPTDERLWFVETVAFVVNENYCTKK
jgi:hypothetical protein